MMPVMTLSFMNLYTGFTPNDSVYAGRMDFTAGYSDLLVLSLGTGEKPVSYDAAKVARWGVVGWAQNADGSVPLVEVFSNGSADMVDYNLSVIFGSQDSSQNYLRVQTDDLKGEAASLDDSSPENMRDLVEIAGNLLRKPATSRNLTTGRLEPYPDGITNQEALLKFAKWLSLERRERLQAGTQAPIETNPEEPTP